jgi:hypothetical protein
MSLLVTLNAMRLLRTRESAEAPVAPDDGCADGCCATS